MLSSQIPRLVWEPEYEPDVDLDLNAMSIEGSRSIAPLSHGNFGSFDKQRRPTYRREAQDSPVLADQSTQLNHTSNPFPHGF
jgi:hypothetical protein